MHKEDIWSALSTERVNVEVMFVPDPISGLMVSCRIRPWKGGNNADRMILAGGASPDEAIAYAYFGLYRGRWIPLNWSQRATTLGVQNAAPAQEEVRKTLPFSQMDFETFLGGIASNHTGEEVIGGLEPLQPHQKVNQRLPKN